MRCVQSNARIRLELAYRKIHIIKRRKNHFSEKKCELFMHKKWKRLHWLAYSKNIFLTDDFSNKQSLASTWCHQDERFSKKPCTIVFTRSFGWINTLTAVVRSAELTETGMWLFKDGCQMTSWLIQSKHIFGKNAWRVLERESS